MSIEQLRSDMAESAKQLALLGTTTTVAELVAVIQTTLWPTLEAAVEELGEVDSCVEDMLHGQEDILQPDTAQLFAALVVAGRGIAAELRLRLKAHEQDVIKLLDGFEELARAAESEIEEITIPESDDEDDEDDDEEEETK